MQHLKSQESTTHVSNDGTVTVKEFNFKGDATLNDAVIVLSGRYPITGYAVNDVSTALASVEEGTGGMTIKDGSTVTLSAGDRLLIKPGEPYYFDVIDKLVIRYTATPAWTPDRARTIQ